MKKLYLFLSISLSNNPIKAMIQEKALEAEEASVLTLPLYKRVFVLRLVMLNRLINEDFSAVSHVIEKTKLDPGPFFRGLFEKGPILGKQIYYKIGGVAYHLYKAALENDHKRPIKLIQDEGCLAHVKIYAKAVFHDTDVIIHVQENPCFKEQDDHYEDLVVEHRNSMEIKEGKEALTKEEWQISDWNIVHKWFDECEAKRKNQTL